MMRLLDRFQPRSLAVYTTVYPAAEPFLREWCASLLNQTDQDFVLWIGVDGLEIDRVVRAMGRELRPVVWVPAAPGDTPAQVRQRALERLVELSDGVVLVDCDDLLHPSRVESARRLLKGCDLAGCSLRLVDQRGGDLGLSLGVPPQSGPDEVLPRSNVFGLSNSAFRCSMLRRCLPIPPRVELVDWYLATRAWLTGGRLAFDPALRMDYRQHGGNMVRVRPPFEPQQLIRDSERVLHHFQSVLSTPPAGARADRVKEIEEAAYDVAAFQREVVGHPDRLERYLKTLNDLETAPLWWSWVAHPALREMWSPLQERI